ncbi:hypothetical protein BDN70DRAFT_870442 [Pholiota conissans]|uniref:C2H2-type domain-containing protein n=1 Tax=Pholiota conissans TaxID=109636 RepID=A0A9P5ZD08_9AGAR|nr:hypothetical protein BDN70DRAFT_870442 [Pholiota conissans]
MDAWGPTPAFRSASVYDRWPVSSSRLSMAGDEGQSDEEPPCHYRSLPTNLFGRSFDEAAADLFALFPKRATVTRSITPSLVSDSGSPQPSTPGVVSPPTFAQNISGDVSPPITPTSKAIPQLTIVEVEESLISATQALGIQSSPRISFAVQTTAEEDEPPVILIDAPSPPPEDPHDDITPAMQVPHLLGPRSSMQQLLEAAKSMVEEAAAAQLSDPPPSQLLEPAPEETARQPELKDVPQGPKSQPQPKQGPKCDIKDPTPVREPRHGRQPKQPKQPKPVKEFTCPLCIGPKPKTFKRQFDLRRHNTSVHEMPSQEKLLSLTCPVCCVTLSRKDSFRRHCAGVPHSCNRVAKIRGMEAPPELDESFYKSCRDKFQAKLKKRKPLCDRLPLVQPSA